MSVELNPTDVVDRIERRPFATSTLIVLLIGLAIVVGGGIMLLRSNALRPVDFAAVALVLALAALLWWFSRRVRQTSAGKLGVVVAIHYGVDVNERKMKEQLVDQMKALIESGPTGSKLQFIDVPQHHLPSAWDDIQANRLHTKSRADLLLYGSARRGKVKGITAHRIKLEAMLELKNTTLQNAQQLSAEMFELFPEVRSIREEDDLLDFEVASHETAIAAKYVIGICSFIARDLDYRCV